MFQINFNESAFNTNESFSTIAYFEDIWTIFNWRLNLLTRNRLPIEIVHKINYLLIFYFCNYFQSEININRTREIRYIFINNNVEVIIAVQLILLKYFKYFLS